MVRQALRKGLASTVTETSRRARRFQNNLPRRTNRRHGREGAAGSRRPARPARSRSPATGRLLTAPPRVIAGKAAAARLVSASAAPGRVADHDDVHKTDMVVDHNAVGERGQWPRLDTPRYADTEDQILLTQAPIFDQRREH